MKRTATKQVGKMRNNDIPGRKTAEQIDNEHMDAFEEKYDRLPRGNNRYSQILDSSKIPPGAPPPATAGGKKLQSTKKNSAKLRVNSFTPRLKNACG